MTVPPKTLQAACRWLDLLRNGSHLQAKSFLWNDARYMDLSRDQYARGYELLEKWELHSQTEGLRSDLLTLDFEQLRIALAISVVVGDAPSWMEDNVIDEAIGDPPIGVLELLRVLGLHDDRAPEVVRRAYGKVDLETRAAVGAAGESALAELLLKAGAEAVEQVSAYDDGAGFDLKVIADGDEHHLEVKSTKKRRSLKVFLSRNEYEVAIRDPSWKLVTVGLTDELKIADIATVRCSVVHQNVPIDTPPVARWASTQLLFSREHLTSGLKLGSVRVRGNSPGVWWIP
ncbi:hypothetical protein CV023_09470 [Brevibacterium sp. CCUG 69071]|nr:hypothetical protein [Brevibacterium sp. CCUG 69071]